MYTGIILLLWGTCNSSLPHTLQLLTRLKRHSYQILYKVRVFIGSNEPFDVKTLLLYPSLLIW